MKLKRSLLKVHDLLHFGEINTKSCASDLLVSACTSKVKEYADSVLTNIKMSYLKISLFKHYVRAEIMISLHIKNILHFSKSTQSILLHKMQQLNLFDFYVLLIMLNFNTRSLSTFNINDSKSALLFSYIDHSLGKSWFVL